MKTTLTERLDRLSLRKEQIEKSIEEKRKALNNNELIQKNGTNTGF